MGDSGEVQTAQVEGAEEVPWSKNRLKREAKRAAAEQKKREKQEERRKQRQLDEEVRKEQRDERELDIVDCAETNKFSEDEKGENVETKKWRRPSRKERREQARMRAQREDVPCLALDLTFESTMFAGEINSLARQVRTIYGVNVRDANPFRLYLTGLGGATEAQLALQTGFYDWAAVLEKRPYWEVFKPSRVVYMTPDSPNELTTIDNSKVYVIGGIVDRARTKNLSFGETHIHKVNTARLPLKTYCPELPNRLILSLVSVYEILLGLRHHNDWGLAIRNAVPPRYFLETKQEGGKGDESNSEETTQNTANERENTEHEKVDSVS
eukprot:comp11540_c0_seq1/m.5995 comp11540_c0_seq1/g.5995  ORF comp11540_c0_seq1/g.5995 comp11540_c0_seq1/m.5995 type:complete len:326 (-) comp11540_c0_seq1:175-1152(-)